MSRAFTRDGQEGEGADVLPDRPISKNRNLVTRRGLAAIDAALEAARQAFATAEAGGDRLGMAGASRDIRYWSQRRASAELITPDPRADEIRFGMAATLAYPDGHAVTWTIVGEDEADASAGRISHVAPVARALYGKGVGDEVAVHGGRAVVTAIRADAD